MLNSGHLYLFHCPPLFNGQTEMLILSSDNLKYRNIKKVRQDPSRRLHARRRYPGFPSFSNHWWSIMENINGFAKATKFTGIGMIQRARYMGGWIRMSSVVAAMMEVKVKMSTTT